MASRGAYVMGRNMFGPVRGEWDSDWRGWWGDEPPYHAPVFVLTHHPRETGRDAGRNDGGASTVRRALSAGAIDELVLDIAPVVLGSGERLLDGEPDPGLGPGRCRQLAACDTHPVPRRPVARPRRPRSPGPADARSPGRRVPRLC
jgi:dihydrofolate reductase